MFFINPSILWSFSYFFIYVYILLIVSVILYTITSVNETFNTSNFNNQSTFDYVTGLDLYWLLVTPLILLIILNFSWSSSSLSAWFGNLVFSNLQYKISYLVIALYYITLMTYASSFYFSSNEVFDYIIVCFNFFFWIHFIFFSNTIFTFIFFIEVISILISLIIITSVFSTTYFYNNLNLNFHNYFNNTTPLFFLQMLLFFFWISLVSSLNLFFSLILLYLKFMTFDWFFFEFIFLFVIDISNLNDVFLIAIIWFNFLFCIFLNCGLVPFYFWNPIFFNGMPMHSLFFYIFFFYFFIFVFFLLLFLSYLSEIFYFFMGVNICILIVGFFLILFILCEAYYLNAFLALSSILNTLFIFLALNGTSTFDFNFYL